MKATHKRFFMPFFIALAALLSACATTVDSRVTTFQRWPVDAVNNATFAFASVAPEKATLEQMSYQNQVSQALQSHGLKPAVAGANARFTVSLDTEAKTETKQVIERLAPAYPLHFYGSYNWSRRDGRRRGFHPGIGLSFGLPLFYNGWHSPFYYGGYEERVVNVAQTTRSLKVSISEGASKVFEATSVSVGATPELSVIMPYLVKSIFNDFPGMDGQTKIVEIDSETGKVKRSQLVNPAIKPQ